MNTPSRPLRIAFGRLMQETNSFSSVLTTRADFERNHLLAGAELLQACQPGEWEVTGFLKNLELSGFLKAVQKYPSGSIEAIPLLSAWTISGGPVTRSFFDEMVTEFCERLTAAGPIDGLMLALHGAMGVEDDADPEATLLQAIRQVVGHIPIAVTFDLHANLTRAKMAEIDLLCAYHTNPHYDMARTGQRAGELLIRTLRKEVEPVKTWRSLPMLLGGGNTVTFLAPMRAIFQRMKHMERDPRVLATNLLMGHPYLDHPEQGWAIEVITDKAPELAEQLADELAECCWSVKDQLPPRFLEVPEMLHTVRQAKWARKFGSVAVCDTSDVVGAGGTGENTHLLKALLEEAPDLLSLYPLRDPSVVAALWEEKEGSAVSISVGGKLQPEVNPALPVTGRLLRKKDTANFGRTLVLDLGHVQLVLTEGYAMPMKPDFYEDLGLNTRKADIVITKNFFHFRIYYLTRSRLNLYVKTQGITDFDRLLHIQLPYPAHPRDEVSGWRELDAAKRQLAKLPPVYAGPSLRKNVLPRRKWLLAAGLGALALGAHWRYHGGWLPRRWRR
ncbi:MAG: M81 family metallopeptidase [Candidatus Sericytochromatia bacterium]